MRHLSALALLVALAAPSPLAAQTVDQVVASQSGGCTTAGAEGLAEQLVRVQLCTNPGVFSEFAPYPNITLSGSRVHPLASVETVAAVQGTADLMPIQINSAFRTLSEQYLLFYEGGCGSVATPGSSNHQTGRAVDVQQYSAARNALEARGCNWPNYNNDPWHFDCPGADHRPETIRTFQRLWNHNNPGDTIDEDGVWGPQTRMRVGRSPAAGFPSEPCGASGDVYGAAFVAQTFPTASSPAPVLAPGEAYEGSITLRNTGTTTWDASTRLGTTGPRDFASPLRAPDWVGDARPAQVSGSVPPDGTFEFVFSLQGPPQPGEYCQTLGVVQEGVAWFSDSGNLGPPDDQLEVCVEVDDTLAPPDAGPLGGDDAGALADAGPPVDAGAGAPGTDAGLTGPGRPGGADGCGCRSVGVGRAPPGVFLFGLLGLALYRRRATRH